MERSDGRETLVLLESRWSSEYDCGLTLDKWEIPAERPHAVD